MVSDARGLRLRTIVVTVAVAVGALSLGAGSASAASVWWGVSSGARPSALSPGETGEVVAWAQNLGYAGTSGSVTVEDRLPAGLKALQITAIAGGGGADAHGPLKCSLAKLSCAYGVFEENTKKEVVENPEQKDVESLPPYELIEVRIRVEDTGEDESGSNAVSVSGGGAAGTASGSSTIAMNGDSPGFGFEQYSLVAENEGGGADTQAGSHPFQVTSSLALNNEGLDAKGRPRAVGMPKTIADQLPPGLIGNPTPFAQCTDEEFAEESAADLNGETEFITNECPADTAIGVAVVQYTDPVGEYKATTVPIFNMVPLAGEPARFGFKADGLVSTFLDVKVRTGGDYGVTVTSENITEMISLLSVRLTFWGVPGDKRHDISRGWECMYHYGSCATTVSGTVPPPFLVLPTSCETGMTSSLSAVSWASEGRPSVSAAPVSFAPAEGLDGCNRLPFSPEVRATPDGVQASSPSGLNVDVHVPQTSVLNSDSLAEAAVRGIAVTLPEGVQINPSGGDGLQACSEGLVGFTGEEAPLLAAGLKVKTFKPYIPGDTYAKDAIAEGLLNPDEGTFEPGINFCSNASKIGEFTVHSPLLPPTQPVKGFVYLATQNQNPFGSLIALYLVAEDPVSGFVFKSVGETRLSPSGQITGVFEDNPQLAFEDAELHFFGGERAPLATPAHCGAYTTTATFTPWSGTEPVGASSTFDISSGPDGKPCPGATLPFSPSLTAGTLGVEAGAFSPLTTTIGREDGEQDMQSVTIKTPPGLSGLLSSVELCPEPQANEGLCGPGSQIGETTVAAGVGSDPVSVTGGKVFITGPYNGSGSCTVGESGCAPFGLSVVNPVKAGPFDLEHDTANPNQDPACDCIVVRAKIEVDPHTAALTVTTDESGAHAIPDLIDGVPVQIQKVNVLIDRSNFTFDPTSCEPMQIGGSIAGYEKGNAPVSVPFQAHDCASLKFAPKFTVATGGRTSKTNGASLKVLLAEPAGSLGTQANIHQVKVELPKALPSRLTTLQKACTQAQFQANPAGCPADSIVGHAVVHTQVLPVPLEGPAYFVSNGGEAFPNLIIVLQGYGVKIDLVGDTAIKNGVTSSTFAAAPDVPFESFELNLPEGAYSALAANGDLCQQKLIMPTEFIAQNGGNPLRQNTRIEVQGCPNAIDLLSKKLTGHTLALSVAVPAAGKLTVSGKGLKSGSQASAGRETVTLKLHVKHGGKLTTKLELSFRPTHGKQLKTATKVHLRVR